MSQWVQSDAITAIRGELDDSTNGKRVVNWEPDIGVQDGENKTFQIPQTRIFVPSFIALEDGIPLQASAFSLDDPVGGQISYQTAPTEENEMSFTFYWTWFTDIEIDHFGISAAEECKFTAYYTQPTLSGAEPIAQLPTDIPDGLRAAIKSLAVGKAANALANRFALKYDISTPDGHSFSPSALAQRYGEISERLIKAGLNARDDFYKGQGTQYRPALAPVGYFLPNWTPPR